MGDEVVDALIGLEDAENLAATAKAMQARPADPDRAARAA
jgi:hypothetical protein